MTTLVSSCEYLVGRRARAAGRWSTRACAAGKRREGGGKGLIDVDQLFQLVHGKHLTDHGGGIHGLRGIL